MPLTKIGKKTKNQFIKEYGKRGEHVFYAYIKSYPGRTITWHKKGDVLSYSRRTK